MEHPPIPVTGIIKKNAAIEINCSKEVAFAYITSGDTLPHWLKKKGFIHGAKSVVVNTPPYTVKGANRTVFFDDDSSLLETLTYFDPPVYYSYSVTKFTNIFKHFAKEAFGQVWFEDVGTTTHAVWVYTFVPKNFLAKMVMWLMLLSYKKFMVQGLQLAKQEIEKQTG